MIVVAALFVQLIARDASSAGKKSDMVDELHKVRDVLNGIKPFKLSFTQQVFTDEQMDLEESGEIIFQNNQQLKWTYLEPDFKVFILTDDGYKYYDQDSEQLIIGKVDQKKHQWIWQLLFSDDIVTYTEWDKQNKTFHIKNDAQALDVQVVVNTGHYPIKVMQQDPSGARMIYLFKDYQERIVVTPEMFQLKLPEDVEIIRE